MTAAAARPAARPAARLQHNRTVLCSSGCLWKSHVACSVDGGFTEGGHTGVCLVWSELREAERHCRTENLMCGSNQV